MRVFRGPSPDADSDRRLADALLDAAATGTTAVAVWRPQPQVAFGRRDTTAAGYERACEIAREGGYEVSTRRVGGRAVAYTGSTVAVARATPNGDVRTGLGDRYETFRADLRAGLAACGVETRRGAPADAFCPGSHALQLATASGRAVKVAGIAQRVTGESALTAGIVLVSDHEAIAAVLEQIYEALDVPFDPETVGSLVRGGFEIDPAAVCDALESAFVGDASAEPSSIATL
jgi:lipoate-protein ligase A